MYTPYDPWGRTGRPTTRPRSVPLNTALALRDDAEQARAALQRCRQDLGAAEQQAASLRGALESSKAALESARRNQESLQQALAEAERRGHEVPPAAAPADDAMDAAVATLRADLANVRRHQQTAVARARQEGRAELLLPMLDSYDDVRRALDSMQPGLAEGLQAVQRRLGQRLTAAGVELLCPEGGRFDPAYHEAVGTAEGPSDVVMHVAATGLRDMDGTVLRPARVVVGDGTREGGAA